MNNKIGFKTTGFKSENFALQKPITAQTEHSKEDVLMMFGYEKAQDILLKFLQNKIYPSVMIEELNQIRRHFFSTE
jgi:hypothetical protein